MASHFLIRILRYLKTKRLQSLAAQARWSKDSERDAQSRRQAASHKLHPRNHSEKTKAALSKAHTAIQQAHREARRGRDGMGLLCPPLHLRPLGHWRNREAFAAEYRAATISRPGRAILTADQFEYLVELYREAAHDEYLVCTWHDAHVVIHGWQRSSTRTQDGTQFVRITVGGCWHFGALDTLDIAAPGGRFKTLGIVSGDWDRSGLPPLATGPLRVTGSQQDVEGRGWRLDEDCPRQRKDRKLPRRRTGKGNGHRIRG